MQRKVAVEPNNPEQVLLLLDLRILHYVVDLEQQQ